MGTVEEREARIRAMREKFREIAYSHKLLDSANLSRVYWNESAVMLCMLDARIWTLDEMNRITREFYEEWRNPKPAESTDAVDPGPQTSSPDSTPRTPE